MKTDQVGITIDGISMTVPSGFTVLQAAQQAGIYIPRICYLENLIPYGGCRLCIVEIKNLRGFPTACTTPVAPNMEIITRSPELQRLRCEILELILSEHPYTCLVCQDKKDCREYMHSIRKVGATTGCNFCPSNGDCELQELVEYLDLKEIRFPIIYRNLDPVKDNPFYTLDYNLCILCGRCVRICNEERNSHVLAFVQRGNATLVGTAFNESQKDAGCEFCGACVDVCPTGSISEKMGRWYGIPDKSTQTTCTFCSVGCRMNVNSRGNHIVNIGPAPRTRSRPLQLCLRGKFVLPDIVHHPDRIHDPLIKKNDQWVKVSWEEAIAFTADQLQKYKDGHFGMIGSSQDTMETNFLLQKFTRKVMRSNHVDLLFSYSEKQLISLIHAYYSTYSKPDIDEIEKADALLIIGSDASVTHPIIENRIRKAYRNGCQVMAANTSINRTFNFTSHYAMYPPGDAETFLSYLLKNLTYSQIKGKNVSEAKEIARILARSKKILIIAGDELLRDPDSLIIFSLLLKLQRYLKASCRILFLLDEGNRYGATLAGMHPDYLGGLVRVDYAEGRQRWSEQWDAKLNETPGMDFREMITNLGRDGITSLCIVGDIFPHSKLNDLRFLMQFNLFLTETSSSANVFFPIASIAEQEGHIMNLEGRLKKVTPVISSPKGVKSVTKILAELTRRMGETGFTYHSAGQIMNELRPFIHESQLPKDKGEMAFRSVMEKTKDEIQSLTENQVLDSTYMHYIGNRLTDLIADMKQLADVNSFTSKERTSHD